MNFPGKIIFLSVFFSLLMLADIGAQCNKSWVKKNCIAKISPFIHNGQINTTMLRNGEAIETTLTFYSGQDYRVLICAEESLNNVAFLISDLNGRIIFNSKEHNNTNSWDFKVKTTTELKILVTSDKTEVEKGNIRGCVSVLVGFKSK